VKAQGWQQIFPSPDTWLRRLGDAMINNEIVFGFDEQVPGLSKIETIDYC
jgi:hypothetical protein